MQTIIGSIRKGHTETTMIDTNAPAEISPWMTFADIEARYRASRGWIYLAVARGELPKPIALGNKRFFSRAAVLSMEAKRLADAEGTALA
jgi:predicted DNA-binding transcriptional regulator AlpA